MAKSRSGSRTFGLRPVACGLWPLLALTSVPPLAAQQKIDQRRAAAPDVSVRIAGTFGSLRIVGTTVDSIIVTGNIPKDARFEGYIGGKGDDPVRGAKIFVDVPSDRAAAGGVLELRVPQGARVWAKAGNATIEATGVSGGLDLNNVGGTIRVTASPRELNVESMDGAVTVDGSPAWVRLKTAAGDITFNGSSEDAGLTTVSGRIQVANGRVERGRFESITGDMTYAGDVVVGGALTFDSHSGAIELRIDRRQPADIEATSVAGMIDNALTKQRPTAGREGRGQDIALSLGASGAHVTIRTFKGTVRLLPR